jgi:hypothetical protein
MHLLVHNTTAEEISIIYLYVRLLLVIIQVRCGLQFDFSRCVYLLWLFCTSVLFLS